MSLRRALPQSQVDRWVVVAITTLAFVAVIWLLGSRAVLADDPLSGEDLLGLTMADVGAIGRGSLSPGEAVFSLSRSSIVAADAPLSSDDLLGLTAADVAAISGQSLSPRAALDTVQTVSAGLPFSSDDLLGLTMADVAAIGGASLDAAGALLLEPAASA